MEDGAFGAPASTAYLSRVMIPLLELDKRSFGLVSLP